MSRLSSGSGRSAGGEPDVAPVDERALRHVQLRHAARRSERAHQLRLRSDHATHLQGNLRRLPPLLLLQLQH